MNNVFEIPYPLFVRKAFVYRLHVLEGIRRQTSSRTASCGISPNGKLLTQWFPFGFPFATHSKRVPPEKAAPNGLRPLTREGYEKTAQTCLVSACISYASCCWLCMQACPSDASCDFQQLSSFLATLIHLALAAGPYSCSPTRCYSSGSPGLATSGRSTLLQRQGLGLLQWLSHHLQKMLPDERTS